MIHRKVTGIGCFAKPATFSRVFNKIVRDYTLGQFESINPANSQDMEGGIEGTVLLKALMAKETGYLPISDFDSCGFAENRKITGFFLTFRNQRLKLSIFAKSDHNIRQIFTTSLDEYTELRHKRLN